MPSPAEIRTIAHADDICVMIHKLRTTTFATLRHRVNECEASGVRKTSSHGAQHQACHQLAIGNIAIITRPSPCACHAVAIGPISPHRRTHPQAPHHTSWGSISVPGKLVICKGSRKPTEPGKRWSLSILLSLICYPIPRKASQKRTPERSNSILHIRFPLSR
jgi:hypothetical protein